MADQNPNNGGNKAPAGKTPATPAANNKIPTQKREKGSVSIGSHIPNHDKSDDSAGSDSGKSSSGGMIDKAKKTGEDILGKVFSVLPKDKPFVWPGMTIPQPFPTEPGGKLPNSIQSIALNRGMPKLRDKNGKRVTTCQNELKICFFFDGTNNHEKADSAVSGKAPDQTTGKPADRAKEIPTFAYPRTSNVTRLFHACMGAGGAPYDAKDDDEMIFRGWFKYYIQGVGTRFEDIGDMNPSLFGEANLFMTKTDVSESQAEA